MKKINEQPKDELYEITIIVCGLSLAILTAMGYIQ